MHKIRLEEGVPAFVVVFVSSKGKKGAVDFFLSLAENLHVNY